MASTDTTDTATTPPGSIIYKKMTVAEAKAAGLDKDPVYAYIMSTLLPLYVAKANDPTYKDPLVDYVKSDLFNKIAADLNIAAKGYNLGAFKVTLYNTLRNAKSTGKGQDTTPTPPVPGAKVKATTSGKLKAPAATSALKEFRQRYKDEITEAANVKLAGEPRTSQDSKFLKAFSEILHERWANAGADEKAEMAGLAGGKKAEIAAGPSAEHIAANQADAGNKIFQLLKDQIGTGWGKIGNAAFYVRGAFTDDKGDVKRFYVTVGPGNSTEAFKPSQEDKTVFGQWAKTVLQPNALTTKGDTGDALLFPDLDVDAANAIALREVLQGLAGKSNGTDGPCPRVMLRIEGQVEVALDDANDQEVREYCRHLLQSAASGSGGSVPPPPAHDNNDAAAASGHKGDEGVPPPPPAPAHDNAGAAAASGHKGDEGVPPPPPAPAHANDGAAAASGDKSDEDVPPPPPPPAHDNADAAVASGDEGALPPPPPSGNGADADDENADTNDLGVPAPPAKVKRGRKRAVKKTAGLAAKKSAPPGKKNTVPPPTPKKRGRPAKETNEDVAEDPPTKRRRLAAGPAVAAARQARGFAPSPKKRKTVE
ncbi:hypothetical protein K438DRAFT_1973622 [Mycena galopus ATCC 62051]|nr:hypothetical protein K438DRAFT_1973622 [Mycena galopus ATCC 62051]